MPVAQRLKRVPTGSTEDADPLAQLIAAVGFRQVNPNIIEGNFNRRSNSLLVRPNARALMAADFGVPKSRTLDLLSGMRNAGFRPAKLVELLTYAKSGWDGKGMVVALESMWTSERTGRCYAPCLIGDGNHRDLCLRRGHLGTLWEQGCQFLVIAK